ncbi:hypothetical protein ACWERY_15940 [Streptomyces sp. NPDC004082]
MFDRAAIERSLPADVVEASRRDAIAAGPLREEQRAFLRGLVASVSLVKTRPQAPVADAA